MASADPGSRRKGGSRTATRKSTKPTGAKAQAFHKLSGSTTRPAPIAPSRMRNRVNACGVARNVRSLGKARDARKRESAMDSRRRASPVRASAAGVSPGRRGGIELAFMGGEEDFSRRAED